MDAKLSKTLSAVTVALLVASVFLVAASAQDSDPTSAPNAVYRVDKFWKDDATPDPFCTTTLNAALGGCATTKTGGPITFNSSWDFTATAVAIPGGTPTTFFLCEMGVLNSSVISVNNANDNAHKFSTGVKESNVTFPNVKFGQVGRWFVNTTGCGGNGHNGAPWGTVGTAWGNLSVNATANLKVTLSQSVFTFTRNQISFTATITDLATGNPAVGVKVDFGTGSYPIQTTNSNGEATFIGQPGVAGTFTVTASRDLNADGHPEFTGKTTWTVAAASTHGAASTTVFRGFGGLAQVEPVHFNATFPENDTSILSVDSGSNNPGNWTINISTGTCWWNYADTLPTSGTFETSAGGSATACKPGTDATHNNGHNAGDTASKLWFNAGPSQDLIFWQDNDTGGWKGTQYTFTLTVNVEGGSSSLPEYKDVVTWTPAVPKAINIKAVDSSSNDVTFLDVLKRSGDNGNPGSSDHSAGGLPPDENFYTSVNGGSCANPFTTDSFGNPTNQGCSSTVATYDNGAAPIRSDEGGYTLQVSITGSTAVNHPLSCNGNSCWPTEAFTKANITVDGDVLTLTSSSGKNTLSPTVDSYTAANGTAIVSHVYPTKGGGVVHIHVNWANTTTTLDLPIKAGAVLTPSVPTVVVDHATPITFTLGFESGDTEPAGEVDIFRVLDGGQTTKIDSSRTFISGNATTGAGAHGQYTFTLNESHVGDYVAFGRVGQTYHNYTYSTFRVVPAHDLTVRLLSAADTLGSLQGTMRINATMPTGDSCFARANASTSNGAIGCSINPSSGTAGSFYILGAHQTKDFLANGSLPPATAFTQFAKSACSPSYACSLWFNSSSTLALPSDAWNSPYSIYVRSSDGKHDNLNTLVKETQHPVMLVFNASKIADNPAIQRNTTITITAWDWNHNPVNGTAQFNTTSKGVALFYGTNVSGGTAAAPQIKFVNGVATVKVTGKKSGTVWFDFDPQSSPGSFNTGTTCGPQGVSACVSLADGALTVSPPNVDIQPSRIPVGITSQLTFTVKSLNGTPLAGIKVRLCGPPIGGVAQPTGTNETTLGGCTGNQTSDASGIARLGVLPTATGNLTLAINDISGPTNVVVFTGLTIAVSPTNPVAGDTITLHVAQTSGNTPVGGVTLTVANATSGAVVATLTTSNTGDATWPNAVEGTYNVTATKAGFESSPITVAVGPKVVAPPPAAPKFGLSDPAADQTSVDVGTPVTFTVKVTNSGDADGTATVKLRVNGVTYDTKTDTIAKGASDTIAFSFTPSAGKAYALTAALPDGTETTAVTVTAHAPVTSTPATSTPPTTTTKPSTSTPSSTSGPTGVPGFEGVFALLGALGAALVIGSRRRK